jgi:hypothetical protein
MHLRIVVFLLIFILAACSKDDDGPETADQKKPLYEVMVVFASGQLGDKGYADNVMEGVNMLTYRYSDDSTYNDTLDIHFISPWSFDYMPNNIVHWADNVESPFEEDVYERRLLVLTEPYMVSLLKEVKGKLRPTDEVLLLKVNEDDVRAAAEKYGLGGQLHGLNISAANSVRRYCKYMEQLISLRKKVEGKTIYHRYLPYYRLYNEEEVVYRDSVYETLVEELGDSTEIELTNLSNVESDGLYTVNGQATVIQSAYILSSLMQYIYLSTKQAFAIVDLGSGNAGWEYSLMGTSNSDDSFYTLIIDGDQSPLSYRCYIKRYFGLALAIWCYSWASCNVGEMPRMTFYWDDIFCTDNIPDLSDLL